MPTIRGASGAIPILTRVPILSFAGESPLTGFVPDQEYLLDSCRASSSATGLPTLTFRRRTGSVLHPHIAGFEPDAADLRKVGTWVSLRFSGTTGNTAEQFVGLIVQERNTLFGADVPNTGHQRWLAVGPMHLLNRINVSKAFWLEDGSLISGERLPSFNAGNPLGSQIGNRSASQEGVSFVFGGDGLWTRRQCVDYLLARFASPTNLEWTVAGDTALLDTATDTIEMGQVGTLGNAIRRILNPQFSLDFTVDRTPKGFQLTVFSLSAVDVTYNGQTVPRNTRSTPVTIGERPDVLSVEFVREFAQRYSRIRLKGRPLVVAFTLDGADGSLIPKWSSALEAEYLAGTGESADPAEEHDASRRRPRLQSVFAVFGAPNPFALKDVAAAIGLSLDGKVVTTKGDHQSSTRQTLPLLPLREGVDYTTGSAEDNTLAGHNSDFQRPSVWFFDEGLKRFIPAEDAGFTVAIPRVGWGCVLWGDVPHRLAVGRFGGAEGTQTAPEFDLTKFVATIAVQLDTRLTMEELLEDGEDDGTVLEVEVPGAELWLAAPSTVTGISARGELQSDAAVLVLRDDRARMAAMMAGLKARYLRQRSRATVTLKGLQPWASAIGSILTTVSQGGSANDIGAPITQVDFTGGKSPSTSVRAGFER